MFPERSQRTLLALCAALTVGAAGCDDGKPETAVVDAAPMPEPEPQPEPEPEPGPQGIVPSNKARVKFKGGERYARDLATALSLPRVDLCRELGNFDCVSEVHRIALGGVEPYNLGIDEPLAVAPVTAAIAMERVALSACGARVDADLADPAAAALVRFSGSEPTAAEREALAADLFDRILRRDATLDEIAAVAGLYASVAEESAAPARDWAVLSCFSVATMLEALFY
ncbi:MAG: hypothetical protein H6983_00010 [Ectothiorhodospiraceae bacterium]|nr:hypothetical protein [Ectothiorhodospiraceae bacterium]